MLGCVDGRRLTLEEVHRFPNGPVAVGEHLHWDAGQLLAEIKTPLGACTQRGVRLDALGIDTWGVDFGLLVGAPHLAGQPTASPPPQPGADPTPRSDISRLHP
jgi:rhamnulokinase